MARGFDFGGQAVLEGVMIRGPRSLAIAVRRPDAGIVVERRRLNLPSQRWPVLRLPIIRGAVQLYFALLLGIDALMFSANQLAASEDERMGRAEMVLTVAASFALAIVLFVVGPTWLVHGLQGWVHSSLGLNAIEGSVRLGILLLYISAISRMPDIRRVLEYHGAEHKVIHALERGDELTVEAVRRHSVLHPRCGTSFLLLVALVSIFLFSFFGWPGFWHRFLVRIAMLPVVAGIAYELIRASGRSQSPLWRPLILPGLWLQRLTTREPDDQQIEVAICALKGAVEMDPEGAIL